MGAPLTARFNRNLRFQEIDGELRRPLWFARGGPPRHFLPENRKSR
jgi:hypothetical protein